MFGKVGLIAALAAAVLATAPQAANAATYYVSPSGNDANPGTSTSAPWRSLDRVNKATVVPGDTVLLHGGNTFSGLLMPRYSGTAEAPITYGSFGTGKANISGGVHVTSVSHLAFRDLRVNGARHGFASSGSGTGAKHIKIDRFEAVNAYIGIISPNPVGDRHWTISDAVVQYTEGSGVLLEGDDMTVQDSRIVDTGRAQQSYNHHGIYNKSDRAKLLRNEITRFQTSGISTRARDVLIEGNQIYGGVHGIGYFEDNLGGGVTSIRYNRLWDIGPSPLFPKDGIGVYIAPDNHGRGMKESFRIYNNTFQGRWNSYVAMHLGMTNASELIVRNNVTTGGWADVLRVSRKPAEYEEDHNLWNTTTGSPRFQLAGVAHSSLGAWQKATGKGASDLATSANLSAAPALAPQPGSPAIDAGRAAIAADVSLSGACTGQALAYCGSSPDLGAVETAS